MHNMCSAARFRKCEQEAKMKSNARNDKGSKQVKAWLDLQGEVRNRWREAAAGGGIYRKFSCNGRGIRQLARSCCCIMKSKSEWKSKLRDSNSGRIMSRGRITSVFEPIAVIARVGKGINRPPNNAKTLQFSMEEPWLTSCPVLSFSSPCEGSVLPEQASRGPLPWVDPSCRCPSAFLA